jgi:plasmid stabilization system protein ParE
VTLIYRPAAGRDLDRAYVWYERERRGLGEEFLAEVFATAKQILENPESYPVLHRQTRRALVRRFPYGLFYRIIGETIVVVACFHTSRNPIGWQRRR